MKPILRYKRTHGLTYPQMARVFGMKSASYLRKIGCGAVKRVSPDLAEQIEERSGGEIRAEELVFPGRPRRKAPACAR